ncbi:Protein FAM24B [Plecturocebus cupreus]
MSYSLKFTVTVCFFYSWLSSSHEVLEGGKAAKESGYNPDKVLDTKSSQAKTIAMESCPALQCCEGCRMYADLDSLPPCYCDVHEGL